MTGDKRIGKTTDAEANKIAEKSYRNITTAQREHNPAPPARYIDEESETPCTREGIDLILISAERARSNPRNPVPSSTELIAMANLEWKNREERRGIHNREDWCCGWMAGFLSEKKPNWTKEQIEAAKSSARKEMAKIISEILDREWMCDLNEIKYILDCVANGNSDPFKDRPGKGDDPK